MNARTYKITNRSIEARAYLYSGKPSEVLKYSQVLQAQLGTSEPEIESNRAGLCLRFHLPNKPETIQVLAKLNFKESRS